MPTKARGFTLVELLVTIVVAAILVAVAVPSFKRTIQSNNMSNAVNTFLADLRYARSEGIRRGGKVMVCRSTDGTQCDTAASTNGWAQGWVVFQDVNGSGSLNGGDQVLRVQSQLPSIDAIVETADATTTT